MWNDVIQWSINSFVLCLQCSHNDLQEEKQKKTVNINQDNAVKPNSNGPSLIHRQRNLL